MTTKFYEILSSDLPAHRDHFLACHQQNMPGNQLAIFTSVDGTKSIVKINCSESEDHICGDCPTITVYTIDTIEAVLTSQEWAHPTPLGE